MEVLSICRGCGRDVADADLFHAFEIRFGKAVLVYLCPVCYAEETGECEVCGRVFLREDVRDGICRECSRGA